MDLSSWILGLALTVLTIALHTTAVVLMAFGLEARIRARVDETPNLRRAIPTVIVRIGAVALILAALHGLEGALWASAYWGLGALDSFTNASVFSLATMSTFEIPGLTLPPRFQMLSALEAMNGVVRDIRELADLPIRAGAGPNVYVRDVGVVENGSDILTGYGLVNGRRTVYIPVTKRADASTLRRP